MLAEWSEHAPRATTTTITTCPPLLAEARRLRLPAFSLLMVLSLLLADALPPVLAAQRYRKETSPSLYPGYASSSDSAVGASWAELVYGPRDAGPRDVPGTDSGNGGSGSHMDGDGAIARQAGGKSRNTGVYGRISEAGFIRVVDVGSLSFGEDAFDSRRRKEGSYATVDKNSAGDLVTSQENIAETLASTSWKSNILDAWPQGVPDGRLHPGSESVETRTRNQNSASLVVSDSAESSIDSSSSFSRSSSSSSPSTSSLHSSSDSHSVSPRGSPGHGALSSESLTAPVSHNSASKKMPLLSSLPSSQPSSSLSISKRSSSSSSKNNNKRNSYNNSSTYYTYYNHYLHVQQGARQEDLASGGPTHLSPSPKRSSINSTTHKTSEHHHHHHRNKINSAHTSKTQNNNNSSSSSISDKNTNSNHYSNYNSNTLSANSNNNNNNKLHGSKVSYKEKRYLAVQGDQPLPNNVKHNQRNNSPPLPFATQTSLLDSNQDSSGSTCLSVNSLFPKRENSCEALQNTKRCLLLENNSAKEVCNKCASSRANTHSAMQNLHLSFCSDYTAADLSSCASGSADRNCTERVGDDGQCEDTLKEIIALDSSVREYYTHFLNLIGRYDCTDSYSVKWNCEHCKQAYKEWLCANTLEFFRDGVKVEPCSDFCSRVEEMCPFFVPKIDTHAGDPSFICKDPEINLPTAYLQGPGCYRLCHIRSEEDILADYCPPDRIPGPPCDRIAKCHEIVTDPDLLLEDGSLRPEARDGRGNGVTESDEGGGGGGGGVHPTNLPPYSSVSSSSSYMSSTSSSHTNSSSSESNSTSSSGCGTTTLQQFLPTLGVLWWSSSSSLTVLLGIIFSSLSSSTFCSLALSLLLTLLGQALALAPHNPLPRDASALFGRGRHRPARTNTAVTPWCLFWPIALFFLVVSLWILAGREASLTLSPRHLDLGDIR